MTQRGILYNSFRGVYCSERGLRSTTFVRICTTVHVSQGRMKRWGGERGAGGYSCKDLRRDVDCLLAGVNSACACLTSSR